MRTMDPQTPIVTPRLSDQAVDAAFDALGHEPVSREDMRAAIAAAMSAPAMKEAAEAARAEYVRAIRDDAWTRGYDACREGLQRHSPYRAS